MRPWFLLCPLLACVSKPGAQPTTGHAPVMNVGLHAELPPSGAPPAAAPGATPLQLAAPRCEAYDWNAHALRPLLAPGKLASSALPNHAGAEQGAFGSQCQDAPVGSGAPAPDRVELDGLTLRLLSSTPAGLSGRKWAGNQCTFEVSRSDGAGKSVELGPQRIPPFNTINAVLRSGGAAWISVGFNGYAKEFPQGGNRLIALDLCAGRVAWQSTDATSNGGLLLYDDYLLVPYGFTAERRSVFVLDAHSGRLVQQLPVIENICPSTSWAPNWKPGDRCDPPGQKVGAATHPRIEGGLFLVDTNTGSASFQFL